MLQPAEHPKAVDVADGPGTGVARVPEGPTLWDLVNAGRIAIEDLAGAVDAFLADSTSGEHGVGASYTLDLAGAVERYATGGRAAELRDTHAPTRRIAVRSALLMARPTRR